MCETSERFQQLLPADTLTRAAEARRYAPMTKAQRKIVSQWLACLCLVIPMVVFEDWIVANWSWFKFPAFLCILVGMALSKQTPAIRPYKESSEILNGVVREHPWIKIYLLLYCIFLAVFIYTNLSGSTNFFKNLGPVGLIALLVPIGLPFFIIRSIENYKSAGK
jgi:hypothetical protein